MNAILTAISSLREKTKSLSLFHILKDIFFLKKALLLY